jgi:transcription initiation factor TFIID subunit 6
LAHYPLRDLAASIILILTDKFGKSSHALKSRLARTFLKHFLDPYKPLGVHYGAVCGLQAIGGPEVVRVLVVPNLKTWEAVVKDEGAIGEEGQRRGEKEMVIKAVLRAVGTLEGNGRGMVNWFSEAKGEEIRERLVDFVGEIIGGRIWELERMGLVMAVLDCVE